MRRASVIFVLGQAQNIMLPRLLERAVGTDIFVFTVYPLLVKVNGCVINIKSENIFGFFFIFYKVFVAGLRLKRYGQVELYSPHLLNFVANKVYYENKDRVVFYYLFDGILNYRKVLACSDAMKKYQHKQKIKSNFVFHKYVESFADVVDQGVDGLRGMLVPEGALVDHIKFKFPVQRLEGGGEDRVLGDAVLVLEPPLHGVGAITFENKLLDYLVSEQKGSPVIVKPHPSRNRSFLDFSKFERAGFKMKIFVNSEPAELVFLGSGCKTVISTTSSALLMIKSLCKDSIVVSLADEREREDVALKEVIELMKESGVLFV